MATTMSLIAKQTVGAGGAASVTFSNIPQTYTDLKIVYSIRSNNTNPSNTIDLAFNGSTSSFTNIYLQAPGPASGSNFGRFSGAQNSSSETANTFSNGDIYIPNYTGSNNKSYSADWVYENNSSSGAGVGFVADLWANTAAITSITVTGYAGNFVEFSTFYLYGISNSQTQNTSVPYASGGDIIRTDGSFWYHTFLSSGNFIANKPISNVDFLVIGGGGGGGHIGNSGGGGAGGFRTSAGTSGGGASAESKLSLSQQLYPVVVGAGGASIANVSSSNGGNSIFATITSLGGGRGGASAENGQVGGSGGGASPGAYTGGAGTASQGYGGGNAAGYGAPAYGGGGGGGAGAVGTAGDANNAGNGGAGVASSLSGSSVTYAGGGGGGHNDGGGGAGGAGGGGAGGYRFVEGVAGGVNTGGGGGGAGNANSGGNGLCKPGGSGIVIIKYPI